jgi:hypothetical protein
MRSRTVAAVGLAVLAGVCLLQHYRRQESASAGTPTNVSFYGQNEKDDNGIGFSGVVLKSFGTTPLRWRGSRVYPVAVAEKDWEKYAYKVLRISGAGLKPILGIVVDLCAAKNSNCKKNVKDYNFLVDVHKTGYAAIGKSDDVFKGSFEVVGSISAAKLPKSYWQPGVRSGSMSLHCRTTQGMDWVALKDIRRCK